MDFLTFPSLPDFQLFYWTIKNFGSRWHSKNDSYVWDL